MKGRSAFRRRPFFVAPRSLCLLLALRGRAQEGELEARCADGACRASCRLGLTSVARRATRGLPLRPGATGLFRSVTDPACRILAPRCLKNTLSGPRLVSRFAPANLCPGLPLDWSCE